MKTTPNKGPANGLRKAKTVTMCFCVFYTNRHVYWHIVLWFIVFLYFFLLFLPVFDPFSKRNACLVTTFSIAIGSNVKSPPPASHVFTSKRSNRKWYRGESSQRGGFLLRSCFVYVFSFTVAVLFVSFLILFFFCKSKWGEEGGLYRNTFFKVSELQSIYVWPLLLSCCTLVANALNSLEICTDRVDLKCKLTRNGPWKSPE